MAALQMMCIQFSATAVFHRPVLIPYRTVAAAAVKTLIATAALSSIATSADTSASTFCKSYK
jgi:hypothetical protein